MVTAVPKEAAKEIGVLFGAKWAELGGVAGLRRSEGQQRSEGRAQCPCTAACLRGPAGSQRHCLYSWGGPCLNHILLQKLPSTMEPLVRGKGGGIEFL